MRFLATCLLCCSCTVVEKYEDGRLVSRTMGIGIMHEEGCLEGSERTRSESFGVSVSQHDAVLGYRSSDRVCLPLDSCGAIFFVESDAQAAAIRNRFPVLGSECLIVDNSG